MKTIVLLPPCPKLDPAWRFHCAAHLRRLRPRLPAGTAEVVAAHAFEAMFLLDPMEAAELWDLTMAANCDRWEDLR